MDKIPLYVKSGSILPMGPALEYPAQNLHPELTLRIYPGKDASFSLYDDEGDFYRCEQGLYSIAPLHWEEASRTLKIGPQKGEYPGIPSSQVFHVLLGDIQKTVILEKGGEICVPF